MFDQGFHIISRVELDKELALVFRHWDASPQQRAEFVGWAWVVAATADFTASDNPAAAAELLRDERDAMHRVLTERIMHTSSMSLELVAKRMFLDWLAARFGAPASLAA
ncbi:MAG: hypothetical protein ACOZQL_36125 [Myxococcota bacterium]